MNPDFTATVPLDDADNTVVVDAVDVNGLTASVTGFSQEAQEPSALDDAPRARH